jgi:hypothetical protein
MLQNQDHDNQHDRLNTAAFAEVARGIWGWGFHGCCWCDRGWPGSNVALSATSAPGAAAIQHLLLLVVQQLPLVLVPLLGGGVDADGPVYNWRYVAGSALPVAACQLLSQILPTQLLGDGSPATLPTPPVHLVTLTGRPLLHHPPGCLVTAATVPSVMESPMGGTTTVTADQALGDTWRPRCHRRLLLLLLREQEGDGVSATAYRGCTAGTG